MNKQTSNANQYYLITQYKNGLLEIGMSGQSLRLRRTVKEVLTDNKLFNGFSITEKVLISSIDITENNKITDRKQKRKY